jgi:LPXTG-motif cell wall-anchored protein
VGARPGRRRMRFSRCVAAGLIGAAGVVAGTAGSASAGTGLSDGCDFLNRPQYDGAYAFSPLVTSVFRAGETITVSVGQPAPGPTPTTSELRFDDLVVDTGGFPAALTHTVPTDGFHSTNWQANQVATWQVSCAQPGIGSSDGGMLADTGPESSTIALLAGVMLVAAGSSLMLAARRRHQAASS